MLGVALNRGAVIMVEPCLSWHSMCSKTAAWFYPMYYEGVRYSKSQSKQVNVKFELRETE